MSRTYYILIILVIVIAIGYFGFFMTSTVVAPTPTNTPTNTATTKSSPTPLMTGGQIIVEGTIDCIPYKSTSGTQPESCQIGLKSKDGKYYALSGLDRDDIVSGKFSGGTKVKVVGTLIKNDATNISVAGTIKITSIK